MRTYLLGVVVLCIVGLAAAGPPLGAQTPSRDDELARELLKNGLKFLDSKPQEALKDFREVRRLFPNSPVAGEALLQVAACELEVEGNLDAARAAVDDLLANRAYIDSATMAYILRGRITVARGRTKANFDSATADYDRASSNERSPAVPAAKYYAGEAHRLNGNYSEAIARYVEVTELYPRTIWAAKAQIGMASALVRATPTKDAAGQAMEGLQRARLWFPDTKDAAAAAARIATLYRLYVLPQIGPPPGQPPYAPTTRDIGGTTGTLKNVVALATGPADEMAIAQDQGVSVYDKNGTVLQTVAGIPSFGVFFLPKGRAVQIGKGAMRFLDQQAAIGLAVPKPDKTLRPLNQILAAAALSSGDLLMSDTDTKTVQRFSASGQYVSTFATAIYAKRLVVDDLDRVAILDRDSKSVVVCDRDGRLLSRVAARGTGYEFRNPVDIAFDAFGHLYVLERDNATVFVMTTDGKLITSFTIPAASPSAFRRSRAMSLDSAGRLYIYDDRAMGVLIYQ